MPRKLLAVVEGDGVALVLVGHQQARCHSRYTISMFAAYMPRQHIARLPLGQGDQPAFVILADDGVSLPVTDARLPVDNFRALIDADAVLDHTSPLLPARITLAIGLLSAQMLAHVAPITSARIDVPVDGLMADLQSPFQREPVSGLFRAEVCPDQPLDFGPFIR